MPELEPITREEKFLNGEVGMTPITREEKILAGEDIETVTRREYFLKKYRGGGGGDITVEEITITENGTTTAPSGKAYSPIHTNVPQPTLSTLEVSENGDYDAPSGTAYNRVEVNVPLPSNAYLLKSVTTPTPIASFNDGEEMVMPSLKVAIEPQQGGSGDPSPTNIRPISGWSEAVVTVADDVDNPTVSNTYTIDLDGTRYGGTLDVVSGVLTVDRGMLTLNGSEAYYSIQSSSADDNTVLRVLTGHVCNQNENQKSNYGTYNNNAWQRLASRVNTFVLGSEGNLYLQIPSSTASTVEEFKALFASNPLQVCYELTTPITIQLTPTQVKSLLGSNNVWADTGDITDAEYFSKEV